MMEDQGFYDENITLEYNGGVFTVTPRIFKAGRQEGEKDGEICDSGNKRLEIFVEGEENQGQCEATGRKDTPPSPKKRSQPWGWHHM